MASRFIGCTILILMIGSLVLMAPSKSTVDRVKAIVAKQLGLELEGVTLDANLIGLGADDLNMTEIILALEQEFGKEIPQEDAEKVSRVQDLIELVS
jgi:acyl carrier protein